MNSHLNIFKTFTKENRTYQLENDLTRALAICFQEDSLFFYEILQVIFKDSGYFNILFDDLDTRTEIQIDIQKKASLIKEYSYIFAVSLSESVLLDEIFWKQHNIVDYDPICDLVISINDVVIIIEAKRDNINCASQLYNQVYNICKTRNEKEDLNQVITAVDFNWPKLMEVAVKVFSFETSMGNRNRFLADFISLVKEHNFRWLPEPAISALLPNNKDAITRRIESALQELSKREQIAVLNSRIGLEFPRQWAQEILFSVHEDGGLVVAIYPGNTKEQGRNIFNKEESFKQQIFVNGVLYQVSKMYHIKFSGQGYVTGLWFGDGDLSSEIYTSVNFERYSGRNKRNQHWDEIESFFDSHFKADFKWREECKWDTKIIKSNRTQFDLSFGYQLCIVIPFSDLKAIDREKSDLTKLVDLIHSVYTSFLGLLDS